jgi:hypothetical protein
MAALDPKTHGLYTPEEPEGRWMVDGTSLRYTDPSIIGLDPEAATDERVARTHALQLVSKLQDLGAFLNPASAVLELLRSATLVPHTDSKRCFQLLLSFAPELFPIDRLEAVHPEYSAHFLLRHALRNDYIAGPFDWEIVAGSHVATPILKGLSPEEVGMVGEGVRTWDSLSETGFLQKIGSERVGQAKTKLASTLQLLIVSGVVADSAQPSVCIVTNSSKSGYTALGLAINPADLKRHVLRERIVATKETAPVAERLELAIPLITAVMNFMTVGDDGSGMAIRMKPDRSSVVSSPVTLPGQQWLEFRGCSRTEAAITKTFSDYFGIPYEIVAGGDPLTLTARIRLTSGEEQPRIIGILNDFLLGNLLPGQAGKPVVTPAC